MYERFTDRARKVMQLANLKGNRRGYKELYPSLILWGLLEEGNGVGIGILKTLSKIESIKEKLENTVLYDGPDKVEISFERLPHNEETKKLLQTSIKFSEEMKHNYVGTEHLLYGYSVSLGANDTITPLFPSPTSIKTELTLLLEAPTRLFTQPELKILAWVDSLCKEFEQTLNNKDKTDLSDYKLFLASAQEMQERVLIRMARRFSGLKFKEVVPDAE